MKLIFLHGLESTPKTSGSAKAIREYFAEKDKNVEVIVPDYHPKTRTYEEIDIYLQSLIRELEKGGERIMLVGISMGGYWAMRMAEQFKRIAACVLLNPALDRYGRPFEKKACEAPLTIIMNADDDVVDNQKTYEKFAKSCNCIMFPDGGHRMSGNMDRVLPLIRGAMHSAGK